MEARSFTIGYDGRARELITDCYVSASSAIQGANTTPIKARALWDTGATNSCISPALAALCKLIPISFTTMHTGNGTVSNAEVCLIDLQLPQNVTIPNLKVTKLGQPTVNFDILIGMDIISHGDFAITCKDGTSKFSFRLPSIKHIDFVFEDNALKALNSKNRTPSQKKGNHKKKK